MRRGRWELGDPLAKVWDASWGCQRGVIARGDDSASAARKLSYSAGDGAVSRARPKHAIGESWRWGEHGGVSYTRFCARESCNRAFVRAIRVAATWYDAYRKRAATWAWAQRFGTSRRMRRSLAEVGGREGGPCLEEPWRARYACGGLAGAAALLSESYLRPPSVAQRGVEVRMRGGASLRTHRGSHCFEHCQRNSHEGVLRTHLEQQESPVDRIA